jgi:osmotically-inducible protein OsmY
MNMKSNESLQKDIQEAIKWEPLLHAAEIGVTVKDGVVTLTGVVDSYAKKFEAENAAKSVSGVKAVVEKIEIAPKGTHKKTDNQLAEQVLNTFQWHWEIPNDTIQIKVEQGWITLEGEVPWNYQKEAARNAVKNLLDVRGVSDHIIIKNESHNEAEKSSIERALARHWSVDNSNIEVSVSGNKVTLKGKVQSWYQKDEAERIAWKGHGVSAVENELVFEYD